MILSTMKYTHHFETHPCSSTRFFSPCAHSFPASFQLIDSKPLPHTSKNIGGIPPLRSISERVSNPSDMPAQYGVRRPRAAFDQQPQPTHSPVSRKIQPPAASLDFPVPKRPANFTPHSQSRAIIQMHPIPP